ncbi:MAG: hypothetical protein ABH862_05120 [Candidatus Omnitrophota bacterium]
MTENGFWNFMEKRWKEGGKATQLSYVKDVPDPEGRGYGQYIGTGHALLPKNYQDFSPYDIIGMGKLLFERDIKIKTKEAILVLLAHQPSKVALTMLKRYNVRPDKALRFYAKFALEECEMWNE